MAALQEAYTNNLSREDEIARCHKIFDKKTKQGSYGHWVGKTVYYSEYKDHRKVVNEIKVTWIYKEYWCSPYCISELLDPSTSKQRFVFLDKDIYFGLDKKSVEARCEAWNKKHSN